MGRWRGVLLACGGGSAVAPTGGLRVVPVASRPQRAEVDPVLAGLAGGRLVVAGTDADLAAVVLRLLRTERLADVAVGYLPAQRRSAVARLCRLPTDPARALDLARHGEPAALPLVRDDAGGVLLGRGELRRVRGEAYCDAKLVLRGAAARCTVEPHAAAGLLVSVRRRGRTRRTSGRAVQLGCLPTAVLHDGVAHPRPVDTWTWYRHTVDWLLVGAAG